MKICVFDFETDSVDPKTCNPVEIGVAIYDKETNEITKKASWLIKPSKDYQLPEYTQKLLKLSNEEYQAKAKPIKQVAKKIYSIFSKMECLVAHNGSNFDMIIVERLFQTIEQQLPQIPAIDTRYHIPFPKEITTRKLLYLCAEYGFIIKSHHRALADVEALCKLLSFFDFEEIHAESTAKKVTVKANVSYDQRQLAKDAGFSWDSKGRSWIKSLSEVALKKETPDYSFGIEVLMSE